MTKFINQALEGEFHNMLEIADQVKQNGFRVYLAKHDLTESLPECPYVIDIEDHGYFYQDISERDLDFNKIKVIFAKRKISYTQKR